MKLIEGNFYYTELQNLRGCDSDIDHDCSITFKYLYSYESRIPDAILILQCVSINGELYLKEYYTGVLLKPYSNYGERKIAINIRDFKSYINALDKTKKINQLGISVDMIRELDEDVPYLFYEKSVKENEENIINHINKIILKTNKNIENTIAKLGRAVSFKLLDEAREEYDREISFAIYEKAYLDNVLYDMNNGVSYKHKQLKIDEFKKKTVKK